MLRRENNKRVQPTATTKIPPTLTLHRQQQQQQRQQKKATAENAAEAAGVMDPRNTNKKNKARATASIKRWPDHHFLHTWPKIAILFPGCQNCHIFFLPSQADNYVPTLPNWHIFHQPDPENPLQFFPNRLKTAPYFISPGLEPSKAIAGGRQRQETARGCTACPFRPEAKKQGTPSVRPCRSRSLGVCAGCAAHHLGRKVAAKKKKMRVGVCFETRQKF